MRNLLLSVLLGAAACGGSSEPASPYPPGTAPGGTSSGTPGNVGIGGAQDFAAFRYALDHHAIPQPSSLDSAGFFAEHFNALPPPTCRDLFCLHGLLSVTRDLVHGGNWTLLQLAMNSPIDPTTVQRPPLDLVVVIDRSGSMAEGDKMPQAIAGVQTLVDQLGDADTLTIIDFDDKIETLFGPARVVDRTAIKAAVGRLEPRGATDIYDALDTAYRAALTNEDETRLRRIIFLTDGLPTAGNVDPDAIVAMSLGYNEQHLGLTTIGLGGDAGLPLLRHLAEQGGGNFYFIEDAQAVTEVFTEELKFFVAPLAYDVELSFDTGAPYRVAELFGTSLWSRAGSGAVIKVPSVYLTSRTSNEPNPSGGRRGGGSALIAELAPIADALPGHQVATAHLRFRLPGSQALHGQDIDVTYGDHPGVCGDAGYYSSVEITKNEAILAFFVAFRDATQLAQQSRSQARELLQDFALKVFPKLHGTTDHDLADDLGILDQYIGVLGGS